MPETNEAGLREWIHFSFVRGTLTDIPAIEGTMDTAICKLETRLQGNELRILQGLQKIKERGDVRNNKIYDTWFRDPCANLMVIELWLLFAAGWLAAVWFLGVAGVVRLNLNLVEQYSLLLAASSVGEARRITSACQDNNSITQLGNVKFSE